MTVNRRSLMLGLLASPALPFAAAAQKMAPARVVLACGGGGGAGWINSDKIRFLAGSTITVTIGAGGFASSTEAA